jgi:uncharacterized RDD family membrane protein YckC
MDTLITPSVPASPPRRLAGQSFLIRAIAYITDVPLFSVLFFLGGLLGAILPLIVSAIAADSADLPRVGDLVGWAMTFLLGLLYFLLCEWLYGATPGKLLCGLRVRMDDGSPCTFRAALIRGLLRCVELLFFGLPAYLHMRKWANKRIGDDLAGTVVVRAADVEPQQRSKWRLVLALGLYVFLATNLIGGMWLLKVVASLVVK